MHQGLSVLHELFFSTFTIFYEVGSILLRCFPGGSVVKNLPVMQETRVQPLGQEDPLKEGMVTHPSVLAWRIPWTEEPGGLYSQWGCKELDMTEATKHSTGFCYTHCKKEKTEAVSNKVTHLISSGTILKTQEACLEAIIFISLLCWLSGSHLRSIPLAVSV